MELLAGYLIPRISAKEVKTSLQIQAMIFGWISRSLAESLNSWPRISDVRSNI